MNRDHGIALVVVALLCMALPAAAQKSFEDFSGLAGLDRSTLFSADGHRLDIIGYTNNERLPAVVVIPGSLCAPVFAALDIAPGQTFATVPLLSQEQRASLNAHLVYLERRNIISLVTMSSAPEFSIEQILKLSPCTEENGAVTLEQRVKDVLAQIRWLRQKEWVGSVHLVGVSEGSDVAAGVAASDGAVIDSLMLVGGAGPSQFADFVAFARKRGDTLAVSAAFDELDQFLSSRAPEQYKGYSSERWQSFAVKNSVLDLLLQSTVPLFIAHGDRDESVPVSSADLVAVELMRKQPGRAIFYWSVVGGDHMLKTDDAGRLGDMIVHYLAWASSDPAGRTFKVD